MLCLLRTARHTLYPNVHPQCSPSVWPVRPRRRAAAASPIRSLIRVSNLPPPPQMRKTEKRRDGKIIAAAAAIAAVSESKIIIPSRKRERERDRERERESWLAGSFRSRSEKGEKWDVHDYSEQRGISSLIPCRRFRSKLLGCQIA